MTLRRAIRRGGSVQAECPHGGVCRYRQDSHGRIMYLSCPVFGGTLEDERGLFARCALRRRRR